MTPAFKAWANKLEGISVFGDEAPWQEVSSGKGLLHSLPQDTPIPSKVELSGVKVKQVRGYLCCNTNDLLRACRLLSDCKHLVIRPSSAVAGTGMLFVSNSEEEMRLYDFNRGPVYLQETVDLDKHSDGTTINVSVVFIGKSCLGNEVNDQLTIGTRVTGLKPSSTSDEFQSSVLSICKRLVVFLGPEGPLRFEFGSTGGQPILINVTPARFTAEHFCKLFRQIYAPEARFMSLNIVPPAALDVWMFWARLLDHDIAFTPGKSQQGVFPLTYIRGEYGSFILLAPANEQLAQLRTRLEEILAEEVKSKVPHQEALADDVRRIWCFSPRSDSLLRGQRYNLPSRFLATLRPKLDYMILPGGHRPTREYVAFCTSVLGVTEDQIIYTSGKSFSMDEDMDNDVMSKLKSIVTSHSNSNQKFILIPYASTPGFYKWAKSFQELGVAVYAEDEEWCAKFGNKSILHRHMSNLDIPSVIETIDPRVRVAPGYTCSNTAHLLAACKLLAVKDVVIKPILGSAGKGILFISSEDELKLYDFPQGDVLLEAKLQLDTADDGIVLSPALHYMKGKLLGDVLVDQIMVGTRYMGWRESVVNRAFALTATRVIEDILEYTKPQGPGGFDFLSVGGLPVLSDVNTARFNGAHQPKMFVERYAPGSHWYCVKYKPPDTIDVHTFWRRLQERGIAFIPGTTTSGVFPMTYLRGLTGTFVSIGTSASKCVSYAETVLKILTPKDKKSSQERMARTRTPPNLMDAGLAPPSGGSGPLFQPLRVGAERSFGMMLIKNATIYDPAFCESRNMSVAGGKIIGFLSDEEATKMEELLVMVNGLVIDASNCIVTPGFVDIHVHLTGGGGEMSFASRTPEANVSDLILGGCTTVVGVLGTDYITRSLENLMAKVEACNEEGITAYMYTGAYGMPPVTLTGSPMKDMVLIKPCVGVGEIAISDHRGSCPSPQDLAKLANEVKTGGLLSGKAGVTYCHMGGGKDKLDPLWKAVKEFGVPITSFIPTHINRSEELLEEGLKWLEAGGYIDLTGRGNPVFKQLTMVRNRGLPMERVIVSSNAHGSLPTFDSNGNLVRYAMADCMALMNVLKKLYFEEMWSLEDILPLVTSNPADALKLSTKGSLEQGMDADILILDRVTLEIKYVFGKGRLLRSPGWLSRTFF
jgi:beta-aspartyl-dipeptidase (metallo-type)